MMTFQEIERLAANGAPIETQASLIDAGCYFWLRDVLNQFNGHFISLEAASRLKLTIRAKYNREIQERNQSVAAYAQYQQNIRAAGEWWNDLPKRSKTMGKDELIAELLAIVSAMVGEDVTAEAVRKAIKAQTK